LDLEHTLAILSLVTMGGTWLGAFLAVKHGLNGARSDIAEIRTQVGKQGELLTDVDKRMAVLESRAERKS